MILSKLENDLISDLAQDEHDLWELFQFVRHHDPRIVERPASIPTSAQKLEIDAGPYV